jgi:hypothetical protein
MMYGPMTDVNGSTKAVWSFELQRSQVACKTDGPGPVDKEDMANS